MIFPIHEYNGVLNIAFCAGIDDDDVPSDEPSSTPAPEEIPPLEGDDDASRMEEVD